MSLIENFLKPQEEDAIVEAIQKAELKTSGEIRVHIEAHASNNDAFSRAKMIFQNLKMHNTRDRNGVLFYIAVEDKAFVILGDKGINTVVNSDFWESTKTIMAQHFKTGDFKTGIISGIENAGVELQRFFPLKNDDANELPNTISTS